jgi:Short C-terminal domain
MVADQDMSSADSQGPDEANDPVEQLQRLAELREQGVLTEDEFTAEKRNILES